MRGLGAQGQAEKGLSGVHPVAIMALAEPMALILVFSECAGDTESHWNKMKERKLVRPFRDSKDFTHTQQCHGCFLFFLPHNNL